MSRSLLAGSFVRRLITAHNTIYPVRSPVHEPALVAPNFGRATKAKVYDNPSRIVLTHTFSTRLFQITRYIAIIVVIVWRVCIGRSAARVCASVLALSILAHTGTPAEGYSGGYTNYYHHYKPWGLRSTPPYYGLLSTNVHMTICFPE